MRIFFAVLSMMASIGGASVMLSPPAMALPAAVCIGKMTNGKPGGDHKFVLVVPAAKLASYVARGFAETNCRTRNEFVRKTKPQMCTLATRSSTAVEEDFRRVYSVTPREICEL